MVNFLRMFLSIITKILKLTYDLTRKGRQSIWGGEQQEMFEEIK